MARLSAYRFEYLTEAEYQANVEAGHDPFTGADRTPAPDGGLGSGSQDVAVQQTVEGLLPSTVYRYRASGVNIGGEHHSDALAFTTEPPGGFPMLDGREWELVSPVEKHGALFEPYKEAGVQQAAVEGDAFTYLASVPTEAQSPGYANQVQVLSVRGPEGWSSRDLSLPREAAVGYSVGAGQEYRFFSEDLSSAAVQPFGILDPSLSAEASEQTPFLRTDFASGNPESQCTPASMPCYRPLVTGCPSAGSECVPAVAEHADVPPGTVFGPVEENREPCRGGLVCGPRFVGATPDLGHVIVSSRHVGLTGLKGDEGGLYEWANGKLSLASVLPSREPAKISSANFPELGYANSTDGDARHAISDDGSRVVWSFESHLYERDMDLGSTVKLDTVQGGTGRGRPTPVFQVASSAGGKVYFTDEQQLTPGSEASEREPDLYECEISAEGEKPHCKLSDLTPAGGVQGTVLGASKDGSYVYFVADGVLAQGATPGTCENIGQPAEPGKFCDLYVRHAGVTKLVAALSGEDAPDWSLELNDLPARSSPDGH